MAGDELLNKLQRGRSRATVPAELQRILARLRNGQRWMVQTMNRVYDLGDWNGEEETFWKSVDEWERLERTARDRWNYSACVIGPKGCDPDAVIQCEVCAGRTAFSGCEIDEVAGASQGALFRTPRSYH